MKPYAVLDAIECAEFDGANVTEAREQLAAILAEVERLRAALEHIRDRAPVSETWAQWYAGIVLKRTGPSPPTAPVCPNCGSASTRYTRADSGECNVCGCIFVWSVLSEKTEGKSGGSHG